MIDNFSFISGRQIYFGAGTFARLPEIIIQQGNNVLLLHGNHSFKKSAHYKFLVDTLHQKQVSVFAESVVSEPSPKLVNNMCDKYRRMHLAAVVATGGGSVIDAGKAVSAMLTKDDAVEIYLEGIGNSIHDGKKIFFIAVPTTAGTGSEATANAVLSMVGDKGYKRSLRHPYFIPDVAIVDPQLMLSCPVPLTVYCGMDAFSQLLESYLSPKASVFTDMLAWKAIECFHASLFRAIDDGYDMEARTGMAFAALVSGICLANAGLGLVHGMASAIGGLFVIPHGVVCGSLLAAANKYSLQKIKQLYPDSPAMYKYAKMGELFTGQTGKTAEYYADAFIAILEDWMQRLHIPKLGDYAIKQEHIPLILEKSSNKDNPVQLNRDEMTAVLTECI